MEKTLHLTLKKKWFDMIASGEKKEEYREIKPHWIKRLFNNQALKTWDVRDFGHNGCKSFDVIVFRHGYASNAPEIKVECKGIKVGYGVNSWGAEWGQKYFVIKLGEILCSHLHQKN